VRPLLLRTSSERRATSCGHARFLRNAIAEEAATPSSFESRSGSISYFPRKKPKGFEASFRPV